MCGPEFVGAAGPMILFSCRAHPGGLTRVCRIPNGGRFERIILIQPLPWFGTCVCVFLTVLGGSRNGTHLLWKTTVPCRPGRTRHHLHGRRRRSRTRRLGIDISFCYVTSCERNSPVFLVMPLLIQVCTRQPCVHVDQKPSIPSILPSVDTVRSPAIIASPSFDENKGIHSYVHYDQLK